MTFADCWGDGGLGGAPLHGEMLGKRHFYAIVYRRMRLRIVDLRIIE
jgi:hypothetical protein